VTDFRVETKELGEGVAVLYPHGYLNNIVGEKLEEHCLRYMAGGVRTVVLNFQHIDFINSIGVSILLGIMNTLSEKGVGLLFTDMSPFHSETFEMLGLRKHMQVFRSEEEAMAHLGPAS
jgi:anti-anti-sigma factor